MDKCPLVQTGPARVGPHLWRRWFITSGLLLCMLVGSPCFSAQSHPNVLLLNSYHDGFAWSDRIVDAVRDELHDSGQRFNLYIEYMDTKRNNTPEHLEQLQQLYAVKYAGVSFDVILSSDDNAFSFLRDTRNTLFPNVPVVFCGLNRLDRSALTEHPSTTGVVEVLDVRETLQIAEQLRPQTRTIYVILCDTPTGRFMKQAVQAEMASFPHLRFEWLEGKDLTTEQMLEKVASAGQDSAVLALVWNRDAAGRSLGFEEGGRLISRASAVPVYGLVDAWMDSGVLGGKMVSGRTQGKTAAGIALAILDGKPAEQIPVVTHSINPYIFDYEVLTRFDLNTALLPPGSEILNKPSSFYRRYKQYIVTSAIVIVILGVTVVVLLLNIRRRREAEATLRSLLQAMPDAVFVHDRNGRILYGNQAACRRYGYEESQLLRSRLLELEAPDFAESYQDRMTRQWRFGKCSSRGRHLTRQGRVMDVDIRTASLTYHGRPAALVVARDITRQQEMQRLIEESEKQFRSLFEGSGDSIFIHDMEGHFIEVNQVACRRLGYTRNQLLEMTVGQITAEQDASEIQSRVDALQEQGQIVFEASQIKSDGSKIPVEVNARVLELNGQSVILSTCRDIRERKRAEQLYETTLKTAMDGFWMIDLEGRIQDVNEAYCRMVGYDRDELLAMNTSDLDTKETPPQVREHCHLVQKRGWHSFETQHRCKDGKRIDLDVSATYIDFDDGRIVSFFRDITERKKSEEQLRLTQTAVDRVSDEAFWIRPDGRFAYVNEAACKRLGYSRGELLQMHVWDVDSRFPKNRLAEHWQELKQKKRMTLETCQQSKDGRVFPVELRLNYVQFEDQEYNIAFARDITERKEAEEALAEAKRDWERIFHAIGQPALVLDGDHRILEANQAVLDALHAPKQEVLGCRCFDLFHGETPGCPPGSCPLEKMLESGRLETVEMEQEALGGTYLVTCTPVTDEQGTLQKIIHIATDITAQKEVERALRESEERLSLVMTAANDGMFDWNITTGVAYFDERYYTMVGYEPGEFSGSYQEWAAHLHPEDRERTEQVVKDHLEGKTDDYRVEFRFRRKDGSYSWILGRGKIVERDPQGYPTRMVGTHTEINERKKAEEKLHENEAFLSDVFGSIQDGISVLDKDLTIRRTNKVMESWYADKLPLEGKQCFHCYQNRSEPCDPCPSMRCLETGQTESDIVPGPAGSPIKWIELFAFPMRDADTGQITGVVEFVRNITQQKQAQEERDRMFNYSADMLCIAGFDGYFKQVNPAGTKILGYSEEELTSRPWLDFVHPEDREATDTVRERKLQTGQTVQQFENRYRRKDGEYRWLSWNSFPIAEEGLIFAVARDVTEQKKMRRQIEEERNFSNTVLDTVDSLVIVFNPAGQVVTFNNACEDCSGYTFDEIRGKLFWDILLLPEERPGVEEVFDNLEHTALPSEYENCWVTKDGRRRLIHWSNSVIKAPDGSVQYIMGTGLDITEQREAELAILESEQRYRTLFESSAEGILLMTPEGFLDCNEQICRLWECMREEIIGSHPADFSPPTQPDGEDSLEKAKDILSHVVQGEPQFFSWQHKTKKGRLLDCEISLKGLEFKGQSVILATVRDVTERNRALAEQARLNQILESTSDLVSTSTISGQILYMNQAGRRLLGWGETETLTDKKIADTHPQWAYEHIVNEGIPQAAEKGIWRGETAVLRPGGGEIPVSQIIMSHKNKAGELMYFSTIMRDITEQKRWDRQRDRLLRALQTKTEELESIVYVSSHDLRTPLVNIQGFSSELNLAYEKIVEEIDKLGLGTDTEQRLVNLITQEVPEAIKYITSSVSKMDILLKGLLKLSRMGRAAIHIEPLDMNELIHGVLGSMHFQLQEVEADVQVDDNLPVCMADAAQLPQVFVNLIDNALKYRRRDRKLQIRISGFTQNGKCVYSVHDNGPGIASEHQERIFEVFHRLTPLSDVPGEGLGLTIVRRILDRMEGSIRVESEPGQGTTFFVSLPHRSQMPITAGRHEFDGNTG